MVTKCFTLQLAVEMNASTCTLGKRDIFRCLFLDIGEHFIFALIHGPYHLSLVISLLMLWILLILVVCRTYVGLAHHKCHCSTVVRVLDRGV